jgi:hypothetical protein
VLDFRADIVFSLAVAGVLTFVIGAIALWLLRRAIVRNMLASAGQHPLAPAVAAEPQRRAASAPLLLVLDDARAGKDVERAGVILRTLMLVHTLAGLVFGVVAALLLFLASGIEFAQLSMATVAWAFAWPTVLVLSLLAGPDRRVQGLIWLGYLGGLFVLCTIAALAGTPPMEFGGLSVPGFFLPAMIWGIYALPSVFLLLFLNRTIRAIGPLVLVFVFVAVFGSQLALALLTLESVTRVAVQIGLLIGVGGHAVFWSFAVAGLVAGAWPGWLAVKWLRDGYANKRTSDLLLSISAMWLLQTLVLAFSLYREQGALVAAAGLVPFAAWRLTLQVGLPPQVAQARARPPRRLLLLRVFGFGFRSRRLLDLLGTRWRLLGSIDLIAAPDLASRTVEPSTFIEFVRGRLGQLFIRTPADLEARLAAVDHQPDPDARFRINQLFCSDAMWKAAVMRLMGAATLVVMDLRGFTPDRRGCVFELQTLLDIVPIGRLVFLIDGSTDRDALERLLLERWQELDPGSPNLGAAGTSLRLLDASGRGVPVVRRLLVIAEDQPASAPAR